jgi:cell division FtsZ-interacting protein ZapD
MSNIIELSALRAARVQKCVLPSENVAPFEPRVTGRRRAAMHTFVFRSYNLIVQSDESDLMRDVCLDIDKAQTKLKAVRRQLQRDRELAEARIELLTSAVSRLSAAIVAARSLKERNQ